MSQNHYEILSVSANASRMTIREAYLRLKNTYSSNNTALYAVMSEEEAKSQLELVEEAFRVLNDDTQRIAYDMRLPKQAMTGMPDHLAKESVLGAADTINTIRSTLKVTRTRAAFANNENIQQVFREVVENNDITDGATLRKLRDSAGVSEEEILERTKISIEYLRAIENNVFDRLPQTVYVKGFIRSYLKYLDVPNPEKIVQEYAKKYELWHNGRRN